MDWQSVLHNGPKPLCRAVFRGAWASVYMPRAHEVATLAAAQPDTRLRKTAEYAARVLDAATGAAECGYVPSKAVQIEGRKAAAALRAALAEKGASE